MIRGEDGGNEVQFRPLVNGTSFQKYTGKKVTLIGVVILVRGYFCINSGCDKTNYTLNYY